VELVIDLVEPRVFWNIGRKIFSAAAADFVSASQVVAAEVTFSGTRGLACCTNGRIPISGLRPAVIMVDLDV
jgi:hypothetical protein